MAISDHEGGLTAWSTGTGEPVFSRQLARYPLLLAFSADGASVLAGGGDNVLTVIDARTGEVSRREERTAPPVSLISVSPDGRSIATMFMKAENMLHPISVAATSVRSQ